MPNQDGLLRNVLFVSYAREDRDTCIQVVGFISPWAKRLGYEVWWDQSQRPGRSWNEQIDRQLGRTGAAIVLVSIDALNSEFIWHREVAPLLQGGVPVAPLLVRDCPWDANDFLNDLQFLNPQGVGVGLNELNSIELEQALANISRGLRGWLPDVEEEQDPEHDEEAKQRQPVDRLPKLLPGELHSVPSLPSEYQQRTDLLNNFRSQLLGGVSGTAAITTPPRIGLHGSGGVGKSVLASALAHDETVRLAFPDGIFWITVGERPDIAILQASLADELGIDISDARTNMQRRKILSAAVGDRRCLFIIDDVWTGEGALSFNLSGAARVLFTTRKERLLGLAELRATPLVVSPLSHDEAIRFIQSQIGSDDDLTNDAIAVIEQTGRVIFALSMAVGAYLNGLSWAEVRERFTASANLYPEELEANLRAMRVAMSTLDAEQTERYCDLVVFPTDEAIPISTIEKFWRVWDLNSQELLRRFQAGRLLEIDGDNVRFHDDQILYLSGRTTDQTSRHAELLNAHKPSSGEWHDLPHDDRYMWNHLVQHLIKAAAEYTLDELGGDIDWIAQHWFLNGPSAVDRDLHLLAQQNDTRHVSRQVLRRVRGIGHLMRGMKELSSVANTLALHLANLGASSDLSRHANPDWIAPAVAIDSTIDAVERVLPGHQGGTLAVTAFPWKSRWHLASAGADAAVKIWDAFAVDQDPKEFLGHEGWVNAVFTFHWRGDWHCASGGDDRKVRVWRMAEPDRPILELVGQTERVTGLTGFEEGGETFLCVGSGDRYVRVYRLSDRRLVANFRGHADKGHSLVAYKDDDGWRVTSGGSDGVLKTWDPLEGKTPRELHAIQCHNHVTSLTSFINGNHRYLAAGHADGSLSICSVDGIQSQVLHAHKGSVEAVVSFEEDEVVSLVSASTDGVIEVRRSNDRFTAFRSYRGHLNSVTAVSVFFVGGSWHLVSASMDGSIRIWDLAVLNSEGAHLEGHTRPVSAITECRLGDKPAIATASEDGTLRVWQREKPGVATEVISPAAGPLTAITSWHVEGGSIVSWGAQDGFLGSVHLQSGRIASIQRNTQLSAVRGMCSYIAKDGRRMLATAGWDLRVRIWDSARFSDAPWVLRGHQSHVNAICAFELRGSPRLVTVSDDLTLVMWDPEGPKPLVLTRGHPAEVRAVTVFLDELGWKAVTGADDGVVRVIDLETDAMPRDIGRHIGAVSSVAALSLPGGDLRIASGSADGRLMLWNPRTGEMTAQVGVGDIISGLSITSIAGELGVAYDARWTVLVCDTPIVREHGT